MAALAHASALLNFVLGGVGGIIAAAIIWLTHKEKSAWVAFHGLQSLAFQIAQFIAFGVIVIVPFTARIRYTKAGSSNTSGRAIGWSSR